MHYGQFHSAPVSMPLAHPSVGGPKFATVMKTEEKGSDVNIATYLLLDGVDGDYEVAVIISGDTDLLTPIHAVRDRLNLRVGVLNPHPRRSRELSQVADFYKPIEPTHLPLCQFPPSLTDATGTFTKPPSW